MNWDLVTNIILATSFVVLGIFIILGLYQLFTRKSLKKVDRELLLFPLPLTLMLVTYFIFDKIWILNTRPDGSGEPSFPSTHVMAVATIFLASILALPKYVKNKPLYLTICILMAVLIAIVSAGRILANKHWGSDVLGAGIFAAIFSGLYFLALKFIQRKEKHE